MFKGEKEILKGKYIYFPSNIPGVFELDRVDKDGTAWPVQYFCNEENAEILAKEDMAWAKLGIKFSFLLQATRDIRSAQKRVDFEESQARIKAQEKAEEDILDDSTEEEKKKEARRKRREARKAKEKKDD